LCHERLSALIELAKTPKVDLTPENIALLQQMMEIAIDAQEDCPVFTYQRQEVTIGLHGSCRQHKCQDNSLQTHLLRTMY
jgi:hypothetical protein